MQNPALTSLCKMHVVTPYEQRDPLKSGTRLSGVAFVLEALHITSQCNAINIVNVFDAFYRCIVEML